MTLLDDARQIDAGGDLTLARLRAEFEDLVEGVAALAEHLSTSEDWDEVRLLLATTAEWRNRLYDAEIPASLRDQEFEIRRRWNSLSWTYTS